MLAKSRDSLSVKFMEFTRVVSRERGRVAAFFEGEDEKYYSIRINTVCPGLKWIGIKCGGKQNVIKMRKKIREHTTYSNALSMFFIDADFDDNSAPATLSDVYITPCYSIENLYLSDCTFERVLRAEFGISEVCEDHECFDKAKLHFISSKNLYLEKIAEFNYLIKSIRYLESSGALSAKLNINNIKFDSLISFDLNGVNKVYDENLPSSIFSDLDTKISIDISGASTSFEGSCSELWFRGKQHLEFFRIYLSKLIIDRCSKNNRVVFNTKGNVKLLLTKGNSVSELSQYAHTPSCLIEFLQKQSQIALAA